MAQFLPSPLDSGHSLAIILLLNLAPQPRTHWNLATMETSLQFFFHDDDEDTNASNIDPGVISYIRNALSKSHVGSLLTNLSGAPGTNNKAPLISNYPHQATPTASSRESTSVSRRSGHTRSVSLADLKRVVSKLTLGGRRSRSGSQTNPSPAPIPTIPLHTTRRRAHTVSSSAPVTTLHIPESTPPLTPDSLSPASSQNSDWTFVGIIPRACHDTDIKNDPPRTREESQRIREGKRPQRDLV